VDTAKGGQRARGIVAACVAVSLVILLLAAGAASASAATISGHVTSAASGHALEGVAVCATAPTAEKGSGHCTKSGAAGAYAITGLAAGEYLVEFSTEGAGYVPSFYAETSSRTAATPLTLTGEQERSGINAELEPILGGGVTGRVVRSKDETPIEGIEVCAWELELEEAAIELSEEGFGLHCTTTDANGEYVIDGLEGEVVVEFESPFESTLNYVLQFSPETESPQGAEPLATKPGHLLTGIDARLDEGGSVSGTVREAGTGTPVAGVHVCALPQSLTVFTFRCATTNAGGEYTVWALAGGSYAVGFLPSGLSFFGQFYNGVSFSGEGSPTPVTVTEGATTKAINASLVPAGAISGVVTDLATGAPLEEILVCALDASQQAVECTVTEEGGTYTIGPLAPGSYVVGFHTTGFATQYFNNSPTFASATRVSVRAHFVTLGVNAVLVPLGYVKPGPAPPPPAPQAGVSASTQTTPVAGHLVLLSGAVPVSKGGAASLRLECEGGGSCVSHLKLYVTRTVVSHGKRRHETIQLGTLAVVLAAGHRTVEHLHLTQGGRNLLKAAHGNLIAKLSISSPQVTGATAARASVESVHLRQSSR